MIRKVDIEKARLEEERKEVLKEIITSIAILIITIILGCIIIYQTIEINRLEQENYKLYVEVQSLKEVIE